MPVIQVRHVERFHDSSRPGCVCHAYYVRHCALQCFAVGGRIAAETAERAEREGKVLDDVKCQMCGFLVEDIWSLMVQRSVMDADPINVDRETTQWLVSTKRLRTSR